VVGVRVDLWKIRELHWPSVLAREKRRGGGVVMGLFGWLGSVGEKEEMGTISVCGENREG
jgi:hypothetical protein